MIMGLFVIPLSTYLISQEDFEMNFFKQLKCFHAPVSIVSSF